MPLRKGPPSHTEIVHIRHRVACGETIEQIAASLHRKPKTLSKYVAKAPELHPQAVNGSIRITTPGGTRIEGLTLTEVIRLARSL